MCCRQLWVQADFIDPAHRLGHLLESMTPATPAQAKPWKGEGPSVLALVENKRGDTFRAVYTVRFAKALNDTQKLKLDSGDCGRALSLYLALRFLEKLEIGNESPMEKQEDRNLSQRQLAILQGLSEAKTNHQISKDLGYSVSTIRHETMRIYEILEVSDRVEAAIVGRRLKFI